MYLTYQGRFLVSPVWSGSQRAAQCMRGPSAGCPGEGRRGRLAAAARTHGRLLPSTATSRGCGVASTARGLRSIHGKPGHLDGQFRVCFRALAALLGAMSVVLVLVLCRPRLFVSCRAHAAASRGARARGGCWPRCGLHSRLIRAAGPGGLFVDQNRPSVVAGQFRWLEQVRMCRGEVRACAQLQQ